jgi:uncharacterized protein YegL
MKSHYFAGRGTFFNVKSRLFLLICLALACGKPAFSGQGSAAKPAIAKPSDGKVPDTTSGGKINPNEIVETRLTGKDIEWFWQCESAPVPLPKELSGGRSLLVGKGPHKIAKRHDDQLSLHLRGFLCPPISAKRDVVIVVDVSDSTRQTDPARRASSGTPGSTLACERKVAVSALLTQIRKQPTVNVGFVTFSSNVEFATNKLGPASAVSGAEYNNDRFCADASGTSYSTALLQAADLLDTGRPDAIKEVYFITDGQPNDRESSLETAAKVRLKATIATIMFGAEDDELLKNNIASKDAAGKPIHAAVTDVKNLASALEALSKSIPIKGTFKYKPQSSENWVEADLWKFVKAGVFDITPLDLDTKEFASGISFSYTYEDNRGISVSNDGKILWE